MGLCKDGAVVVLKGEGSDLVQLSQGVVVTRNSEGAVTQYHDDGRKLTQGGSEGGSSSGGGGDAGGGGENGVTYVAIIREELTYDLKSMLLEEDQGLKDKELALNAEKAKREAKMQQRLRQREEKKAKQQAAGT